jgi:hypothetical protein
VITLEPVPCANCGRLLRRVFFNSDRKHKDNQVFSRTLVRGVFMPSCGERCRQELRVEAGLAERTEAA